MANTLTINSGSKAFSLEPLLGGVEETQEKIWSKNTGRSTSGKMTGDIIAIKLKLKVSYPPLTKAQKTALNSAVSDAFFDVTYLGKNYTMYAGTPTYPVYDNVDDKPRYVGVGVDLIEQ